MNIQELRKKRIGVLMGGNSSEREISLLTGKAIVQALRAEHFQITPIDVSKDVVAKLTQHRIGVAFLALHGLLGEDGSIQGLLEVLQIPYTGSGVLASALAMNKIKSKEIFCAHNISTPGWRAFSRGEKCAVKTFPVVVKPANQGSAVGVSIVENRRSLAITMRAAFQYDVEVLVEEYIKGTELTVGVLNGKALPVIKIVPQNKFYDFESKYAPGGSIHVIPSGLPVPQEKRAQELALACCRALGCRGASRVDIIYGAGGNFSVLEVNTIPGMTPTSLLPDAAKAAGYSFNRLVIEILKSARLEKSNYLEPTPVRKNGLVTPFFPG